MFGPGRILEGSRGGFGYIWTKFQPRRTILDPFWGHFRFSTFGNPHGAQWSQASLGSGTIWDPGSMEAEGRLYGGLRLTLRKMCGDEPPPPPADTAGVLGVGGPPTEKELFAIAKSGTLRSST